MDSTRKLAAVALVLAIDRQRRKKMKRRRKCWARDWLQRRTLGTNTLSMLQSELREEDPQSFQNFTRMEDYMFDELLECVRRLITKQDTNMRQAIPPEDRLAATLDFLASGSTFEHSKFSTRMASNTLSGVVTETLKAIVYVLENKCIKAPSTPEEWKGVADQFMTLWQFPHCLGALDGKHVNLRPPHRAGSLYRNYKKTDSIILMALVDAKYRFLYIDVGKNGRCNDSTVFKDCSLGQALSDNVLPLPKPEKLPFHCQMEYCSCPALPYVIVADDAFSLKENLMKPYPERDLTNSRRIFNYRLSRARRIVENAFGIMANRFQILQKTINLSVEKIELIVTACCVLHNFIIDRNPSTYLSQVVRLGTNTERNDLPQLDGIFQQGGNRTTNAATQVRDKFAMYFSGNGSVPWQDDAVNKGNW